MKEDSATAASFRLAIPDSDLARVDRLREAVSDVVPVTRGQVARAVFKRGLELLEANRSSR